MLLLAGQAAIGQGRSPSNQDVSVARNLRVVLSTDKLKYFVGENVLIDFAVTNESDRSVRVQDSGRRSSWDFSRPYSCSVVAVDEKGAAAPEPSDDRSGFEGGLIGYCDLAPGQTFHVTVPLSQYRTIGHARRYSITITHALGFNFATRDAPSGTLQLTFLMPDAEQARSTVDAMAKLKPSDRRFGEKAKPQADFKSMSEPIYLTPLVDLAKSGDARAIDGVDAIATPEATAALLSMLRDRHTKVAQAAGVALSARVPFEPRDRFNIQWASKRRTTLAAAAWRSEFDAPARTFARGALNGDSTRVAIAAVIFGGVGTRADLPSLMQTLDRAADESKFLQDVGEGSSDGPDNAGPLEQAIMAIDDREGVISTAPVTVAERIILARAVGADKSFRPPKWEQIFQLMLAGDIPYEQLVATQAMPLPIEAMSSAR